MSALGSSAVISARPLNVCCVHERTLSKRVHDPLHRWMLSVFTLIQCLDLQRGKADHDACSSSEPKGQELGYAARIFLDRAQMQIEEKAVNLSAGVAVTVEIKTGSRRVITYLLSPLPRDKQEALRER
jgi:hemolysin D